MGDGRGVLLYGHNIQLSMFGFSTKRRFYFLNNTETACRICPMKVHKNSIFTIVKILLFCLKLHVAMSTNCHVQRQQRGAA